jgi:hypothetical protein
MARKTNHLTNTKMKFLKYLTLAAACAAPSGLQAHISYTGRDFGALVVGNPATSNLTQTVSSSFGWADATDDDWGDSHRGRFFRFTLNTSASVMITVDRNASGTGAAGTFLPAFSLFSGLAQRGNNEGVQQGSVYRTEALAHDSATLSVGSRPAGTEGSFRALTGWSIGNDPTYVTAGDPASGVLIEARLASFTYLGHAADGTSANFGLAPGINGDGNADGSVTATFHGLAPGNYSFFVGGANYAAQTAEPGPTFPSYGVNVTVQAVPEPSTYALLAAGGAVLAAFVRRRIR